MKRNWVALAAIAVIYVLFRFHSLPIPLDRDEGMFGYGGQRILEGGKLYLDAVDHKPPGVFYLYALALCFVPATAIGVHLFLAIYNFLTLLVVALLARVRFPKTHAWLGAAFCYAVFSASPAIQGFTASSEMLMLLPITLSVLLAVAGKKRGRPGLIILSGVSGAMAFWIKQTAATAVAFAPFYLIAASWLDDDRDERRSTTLARIGRDLFLWIAGAALFSAAVAGYFYSIGLYPQFVYWNFTHNVEYAGQIPLTDTVVYVLQALREIMRGDFVVVGFGLAVAFWYWKRRRSQSFFVLGFLAFSLVGTLPGFAFPHYFAQLAPAVGVASGWAMASIPVNGRKREICAYISVLLIAVVPVLIRSDYFWKLEPEAFSRQFFSLNPFPESPQLSAFLANHTTKQDRVFIFGSEPQILFEADRKSATPFAMIYPLTHAYPRYLEFQEQVWHDLQQNRPAYLLLVDIFTSILWDGQAKLEIAERFQNLVQTQYHLVGVLPVRPNESPGKLLLIANGQNLPEGISSQNQPNIYIYQRNGN